MSRLTKDSSLPGPSASTSQEDLESGASSASNRTLKVTLLSSEWRSTKGGLSTINRELAIQLAKHPNVEVCMYLPQCSEEDKRAASCHKVHLIEAEELIGYEPIDSLACLPENHHLDCIIGHGLQLGRQVQLIQRQYHCKWIQVVHTAPEDLGMFKDYAGAISRGEEKHLAEIKLCEKSNQVVAVGPKLADAYSRSLRYCQKAVFKLTPSIFSEFSHVEQATEENETFCVLVFGRGDDEDFELKGYDIAAEAIAELNENSYRLMFVGAPPGKEDGVAEKLCQHGISRTQLTVRSFKENREDLANLFCEVDLAIMPSRTEGFGLAALEALSAGLPVLVSGNSGLGDALKKVPHGSNCVVNSDDSKRWAEAIRAVRNKDRAVRLEESKDLRRNYAEKYSWEKQCGRLVQKMMDITFKSSEQHVSGKSKRLLSPSGTPARKQCKVLTSGPEGSSKAQASESGKRPSSSRDASSPKKRKMVTGESEDLDIATLVKLLKTSYRRRSQLRPLIADSTIQLELEKVYTRLKIISRPRADDPSSGKEVNVYDVFGEYEKGEDFMALAEGSPGIGKTTLCLKLAYDWAVESVTTAIAFSKFELVLLLKCRDFDGNIMEAISEQLLPKDINKERRKTVVDFIKDIHNQERILIILDGLDELPQKSIRHVDQLLDRRILPFCHVFATCRQERGIKVRKNFKFDILLEIEGFTESDACEYIRKHFKHLGPDLSSKGEKLIEEIKENTFLHALRNNPLNLLLLCVIYEDYEGKLPSSRTKLYQEIVECLLRRYCARHNVKAPKKERDLEERFKRDILALGKLAWKCLLEDHHSFCEDKLKELEKRNRNLVVRGLGLLYKEESLKRFKPQHEYFFLHKTFQEYLAAFYIAHKLRRKKYNVFDRLAFDNLAKKYPQVFLFVSGLLGEEASLLFQQIGKELEGHWDWNECGKEEADFFIISFSESENGQELADTLCSFIPFPVYAEVYHDIGSDDSDAFARVLGACKSFSNLQKSVNLLCGEDPAAFVKGFREALDSCSKLETLSIRFKGMSKEVVEVLFQSLAASTSISQLTLTVSQSTSSDTIAMIGSGLTKSNSLTQVALKFPGIFGTPWFSVLETGLSADTPLSSVDLIVWGPMSDTAIQALEKLLSNESLNSLSLFIRGDMQDLLAAALRRGLTGQISIRSLCLRIYGKLNYRGAESLEKGFFQNGSLSDVRVFVHGELPENWRTVAENVRLAKKSQVSFVFYTDTFSKVTSNEVGHFRPFVVEEGFSPNQHLTVNVCGELTIEGADALCEVVCPSLSSLTINLYGKLTDGISHLSTRCSDLPITLSSVTVNIWGKLTEEEKTLSQHIINVKPAISLNVLDMPIPPDDSSSEGNVTIDNPASLETLLTEVKHDRKEKLSITINFPRDTYEDWTDHSFDVLADDSTLKELTVTIHGDCSASEVWGRGLGNALRSNSSIRALTLAINIYGDDGEWEVGLGQGLEHNTTISTLTLTINYYEIIDTYGIRRLSHGFANNRSVHTLTLTINYYINKSWLHMKVLGEGLARSKSLTSCNLVFNMHGAEEEDYLPKLCEHLMRSESLTTLALQVNDDQISDGSRNYDLSKVLVKSRSLCSIDLTVSFYGTETDTSDTSDTSDTAE